MTTKAIKKGFVTGKQLMLAFAASHMTIYNWTNGTATRDPIPSEKDGSLRIYKISDVKKWAKQHDVAFIKPLDEIATNELATNDKRGPKPGKSPVAAKKAIVKASKAPVVAKKVVAKTAKPAKKAVVAKKASEVKVAKKVADAPQVEVAAA